jgi:nitrous-oxide reductase
VITLWKFDRAAGRIDMDQIVQHRVPPYWQDLCDAGKLASDGWASATPFNSEMATGGIERATRPLKPG